MKHSYQVISPMSVEKHMKTGRWAVVAPFDGQQCHTLQDAKLRALVEQEAKTVQSKKAHTLTVHDEHSSGVVVVWFDDPTHEKDHFCSMVQDVAKELEARLCDTCVMDLRHLSCRQLAWRVQYCMHGLEEKEHHWMMKKEEKKETKSVKCFFVVEDAQKEAVEQAITLATALESGLSLMTMLANQPANIVTPAYVADAAKALEACYPEDVSVEVLEADHPEVKKMGAFLSVAQGSEQSPRFVVVKYQPKSKEQPVVLVGKGVTFDTGGISLKPANKMEEMKFDMTGAATVLSVVEVACQLKLKQPVVSVMPLVENMPSGSASRPGDVVRSYSGQTVEIRNTDAEGRLILADALSYAARFNPKAIVDVATLTGAILVALGDVYTGLFSNSDTLAKDLEESAEHSGDLVWRLPMKPLYQQTINTSVADVCNIRVVGAGAGSITAACFLERFVPKNVPWAHLDIAGSSTGADYATGRPLYLLVDFLMRHMQ